VNLKSLFHMNRAAVPAMRANPGGAGGVFVNVASTTGQRPGPGLCWYSASKGAVITASKGLALELARDAIRMCVINPMLGETGLLEQFMGLPDTPENRARFLARVPLGRLTRPADVADAAVYLASDEAAYLTGTCTGGRRRPQPTDPAAPRTRRHENLPMTLAPRLSDRRGALAFVTLAAFAVALAAAPAGRACAGSPRAWPEKPCASCCPSRRAARATSSSAWPPSACRWRCASRW
jgi:hypothetical protein